MCQTVGHSVAHAGCGVQGGGGLRSAQHHQEDGLASSPGRLSMGTEQCAVVVSLVVSMVVSLMFSNLKLWSRWFRPVQDGGSANLDNCNQQVTGLPHLCATSDGYI